MTTQDITTTTQRKNIEMVAVFIVLFFPKSLKSVKKYKAFVRPINQMNGKEVEAPA